MGSYSRKKTLLCPAWPAEKLFTATWSYDTYVLTKQQFQVKIKIYNGNDTTNTLKGQPLRASVQNTSRRALCYAPLTLVLFAISI